MICKTNSGLGCRGNFINL